MFSLQNPMILDVNADQEKVKNLLTKLSNKLESYQKQAFQYKNFQKNFKVRKE